MNSIANMDSTSWLGLTGERDGKTTEINLLDDEWPTPTVLAPGNLLFSGMKLFEQLVKGLSELGFEISCSQMKL
ncbi:MAG: hypothetical protein ABFS17_09930 [Chloroflexota bacterium]